MEHDPAAGVQYQGEWTPQMKNQFLDDGFLIVRGLFTKEEIGLLEKISKGQVAAKLDHHKGSRGTGADDKDQSGKSAKYWLSNEQKEDIHNAIVKCKRMASFFEYIWGEPSVDLYHYKVLQKEAKVGGAWEWHQDWWYWYNKFLYPRMGIGFMAVDPHTEENGCLKLITKSHKLGRIKHNPNPAGKGQDAADPVRLKLILAQPEHKVVPAVMEPGDIVLFDVCTLHHSGPNTSNHPRWAFAVDYCSISNKNFDLPDDDQPAGFDVWDDSRVLELGRKQWAELVAGGHNS